MRDRSPPCSLIEPTSPSQNFQEPRHWSLQAPGILRATSRPKPSTTSPTAMPSVAPPNLNTPIPPVPSFGASSSKSRSKAISLPASPTLSSTDLTCLANDPIPLFSLDVHCSSPTHCNPSSLVLDHAKNMKINNDDEDDPMDTADDGECASRTHTRSFAPYPHVRSISDSHHHVHLGTRGLKRSKSIGKVMALGGDAPKISSYFRTLKRTGAAHGPGLFTKSLSDPTLAPAVPAAAVVGRPFKRVGTPAMTSSKGHAGGALLSTYFTKPGAFKSKPVAWSLASTRTGEQTAGSPRRRTIGSSSYAAKSILADAFERMSISTTPTPRTLTALPVGTRMGFVDGGMATVQFEKQQLPGGLAASAVTELGYAPRFPGMPG